MNGSALHEESPLVPTIGLTVLAYYLSWLAASLLSGLLYTGGWADAAIFGLALTGVAGYLSRRSVRLAWQVPASMYVGLTLAVFLQVVFDSVFRSADHNLLPIEFGLIWVFAAGPVALGALLGRWLRRREVR